MLTKMFQIPDKLENALDGQFSLPSALSTFIFSFICVPTRRHLCTVRSPLISSLDNSGATTLLPSRGDFVDAL